MSAADLTRWVVYWQGRVRTERQESGAPPNLVEVDSLSAANGIGAVLGYSNGWFHSQILGHTVIWHDGNRGGFNSCVAAVQEVDLTVVVLANRGDIETKRIVEAALTWMLAQGTGP